jgi:hypothetical protein
MHGCQSYLFMQVMNQQLAALSTTQAQSDLCANVARLLAELTMHFVSAPDAYCVGGSSESPDQATGSPELTSVIDDVLQHQVLPLLPNLTAERDPMPLYAQKILALLLTRFAFTPTLFPEAFRWPEHALE